jgi:glycosyltransferase involved in cell wall biosynthesis
VVPHLGAEDRQNWLQHAVRRTLRRKADTIVVHGDALARLARSVIKLAGAASVVSIPHGVLQQDANPTSLPASPCILLFGRMEFYKGIDVLVRAAEVAADYIPDLRVIVAGTGPEVEPARALVSRPELFEWRVGFVPDSELPRLFSLASVVALPYREASQSGVVPLAFANGRSVIASNVGALAEAVDDGITGILVPPGDVQALADALVRFHRVPGLASALTAAALAEATSGRMSAHTVASTHLALYRRMIEGSGS